MRQIFFLTTVLLLVFSACKQKVNPPEASVQSIVVPAFNADSAYSYVEQQTLFGPRVPNTAAHKNCAQYLFEKLNMFCDTAIIQYFTAKTYHGQNLDAQNIIGIFNPDKQMRILLAAHWDSRPYADQDPNPANRRLPIDGANDGASGVGVLVEVARQLSIQRPEIGIDIIFFDAEDYGEPQDERLSHYGDFWCLGSQYWAKNPHLRNYNARFGILLDMVGGENPMFTFEAVSRHYAPDILSKVWKMAHLLGYDNYFKMQDTPPITDDHTYINMLTKIPMIDIIEYNPETEHHFYRHWHTVEDNITHIHKPTLEAVGKVVLAIVYHE